jgi:hypothetical protein
MNGRHQEHDHEDSEPMSEVTLKSADDVLVLERCRNVVRRVEIFERFFGPGFISPSWKQRMALMRRLGTMDKLQELVIRGTIMGQVIPGETLGIAIGKGLTSLTVHAGVILDGMGSVTMAARALIGHRHLEEVRILNFSNLVLDVANQDDEKSLLDPLVMALTTIPTLQILELTCMASYTPWDRSFLGECSISALLMNLPRLHRLNLTNFGLQDHHFAHIVDLVKPNHSIRELVLNGNRNSDHAMTSVLNLLATNRSLYRIEVVSGIPLSDSNFVLLQRLLEQNTAIEHFACTCQQVDNMSHPYHLQQQRVIDFFLGMNRKIERAVYLHPNASLEVCVDILSVVNAEVEVLLYMLKQKPHLCKLAISRTTVSKQPILQNTAAKTS